MGILCDFFRFWNPIWFQNGGKLGIENALLLSLPEKGENPKRSHFSNRILIFFGFGWSEIEAKIHQKSMKQRPQHGKASWHRFFWRFWWILVDFGRQVGKENRAKIDQKRQRKTMKKWMPPRCQKKSQQEEISMNLIEISPMLQSGVPAVGRVGRGNS